MAVILILAIVFFGIYFVPIGVLAHGWKGGLFSLAIVIILSVALASDVWIKDKEWNDGICIECGGEYKLNSVSKSKSGIETKYYTCEDCDHLIRQ